MKKSAPKRFSNPNPVKGKGVSEDGFVVEVLSKGNLDMIYKQARSTGKLLLANKGLKIVPPEVFQINSLTFGEKWWELVEIINLDLHHNEITSLPEDLDISNLFAQLKVLDIANNALKRIPPSFFLSTLNKLDLSNNALTSIPDEVGVCNALSELLLNNNMLKSIPQSIGNLTQLSTLCLHNNDLKEIPDEIRFLTNLRKITLHHNQLISLPPSFSNLNILTELELNSNKISLLPPLNSLPLLMRLDLRENKLAELPLLPPKLAELYLGFNLFLQFPMVVCSLLDLKILDIRDNKLEEIPEEICKITGLKRLDLTNNNLQMLPPLLATIKTLNSLNIEGNPLKTYRRDIVSKGTVAFLEYLKTKIDKEIDIEPIVAEASSSSSDSIFRAAKVKGNLDLSSKKLSVIPAETFETPELTLIKLNKNMLQVVPPQIVSLKNLSILDLSENKIPLLPKEISFCDKITELYLFGNILADISPVLSLRSLKILDVRINNISVLPSEGWSNLVALQELRLGRNAITTLPLQLFSLSIFFLDVASNKIEDLPVEVTKLSNLTSLDISNNNIVFLPPQLGLMTQLRALEVQGNILKTLRPAVIQKGTLAILEALRMKIP